MLTRSHQEKASQLSRSSSSSMFSTFKIDSSGRGSSSSSNTILTNDQVIEQIFRFVGTKQYRFIGSINQQYHRMYTSSTTPFIDTISHNSKNDNNTATNSRPWDIIPISINDKTHRQPPTKQTLVNISTMEHFIICYKDVFQQKRNENDEGDNEDYYERRERETKEAFSKNSFYTTIGKYATIEQLDYLYNTLQHCDHNAKICTAAAGAGRLLVIQFVHEHWKQQYRNRRDTTNCCCALLWDVDTCAMAAEFGHLDVLQYLHAQKCPWNELSVQGAVKNGHIHILQFMDNKKFDFGWELDDSICEEIGKSGQLDALQFFQRKDCILDYETICYNAAYYDQMDMFIDTLDDLDDNEMEHCATATVYSGNVDLVEFVIEEKEYQGDSGMCAAAAECGNLPILQYLRSKGVDWDESTCRNAAGGGHLHILQYAYDNGCPWTEWTCVAAAESGDLNVLRYAHHNGCAWNAITCWAAASKGHLHCLQYARDNGCEWDILTCTRAAEYGHLHVLKYAHEHGCLWDETTCTEAAKRGDLTMLQYAHENGCPWNESVCTEAVKLGHLKLLIYARDRGCPWDAPSICQVAAKHGDLKMLKYAHENGCPLSKSVCNYAALGGYLNVLQYARKNGCPWDTWTCRYAASRRDNLHLLKYVHENGCPWDTYTINSAIVSGSLDMLQYARKNGCPWNESTICTLAAANGHLKILQYLRKQGCPWDESTCTMAAENGHLKVLQYAYRNGCNSKNLSSETGNEDVDRWIRYIKKKEKSIVSETKIGSYEGS